MRLDFFAFLVENELEYLKAELESEIESYLKTLDEEEDLDQAKKDLSERFNEIIDSIPDEDKREVYRDAQALYSLRNLCRFSFSELLGHFKPSAPEGERSCGFQPLTGKLIKLAELLKAAAYSPSINALRALFFFYNRERLTEDGFNVEKELFYALQKAQSSMESIREFNSRIPLIYIIRYANRDPNFKPKRIGGGEDWFVSFKEFWQRRIEKAFGTMKRRRKRKDLLREALYYLGIGELEEPSWSTAETGEEKIKIHFSLSYAFAKHFVKLVYSRVKRPLGIVAMSGEFYKDQNRREFNEAYQFLDNLLERMDQMESRLSENGDVTLHILEVQNEVVDVEKRNERIAKIYAEFDKDIVELVERSIKEVNTLSLVLSGIMHGEPGARYDTLSNLNSIGGRNNRYLLTTLEKAVEYFSQGLRLLVELKDLES
jgi:hypothetical protein